MTYRYFPIDDYILIGGVACDLIFNSLRLEFKLTNDFDIVVISEHLQGGFGVRLKQFIHDGGYAVEHRKSNNRPTFFRFVKPKNHEFPDMLELASNKPPEDWAYHFAPLMSETKRLVCPQFCLRKTITHLSAITVQSSMA